MDLGGSETSFVPWERRCCACWALRGQTIRLDQPSPKTTVCGYGPHSDNVTSRDLARRSGGAVECFQAAPRRLSLSDSRLLGPARPVNLDRMQINRDGTQRLQVDLDVIGLRDLPQIVGAV